MSPFYRACGVRALRGEYDNRKGTSVNFRSPCGAGDGASVNVRLSDGVIGGARKRDANQPRVGNTFAAVEVVAVCNGRMGEKGQFGI